MNNKEAKHLHISETATVNCRLCGTTMRRKHYKAHLRKVQPWANCEDLSGWSQPKIRNMFKIPKVGQAHIPGPSAVVQEADHQGIDVLPVDVHEDSRQPHISNISPDLAAESDIGGEKIHEGGPQNCLVRTDSCQSEEGAISS